MKRRAGGSSSKSQVAAASVGRVIKWLAVLTVGEGVNDDMLKDELVRAFSAKKSGVCLMRSYKRIRVRGNRIYLCFTTVYKRSETIEKCLVGLGNGISVLKWDFGDDDCASITGKTYFRDCDEHRICDTKLGRKFEFFERKQNTEILDYGDVPDYLEHRFYGRDVDSEYDDDEYSMPETMVAIPVVNAVNLYVNHSVAGGSGAVFAGLPDEDAAKKRQKIRDCVHGLEFIN